MTKEFKQYRDIIRESMQECGWRQEDLARRMGITRVTLNQKLNGKPFNEDEMIQIKRLFRWKSLCSR